MSGERVLIVDQQTANGALCSSSLSECGFDVIRADNAPSALRMVAEHKPDVVLVDCTLVRGDGHRMTRGIKALSQNTHIPVVAYGDASESNLVSVVNGVDQLLTTPLSRQAIIEEIEALLDATAEQHKLSSAQPYGYHTWLQHFVAPGVLKEIEMHAENPAWQPTQSIETVTAAVLFADIRGFTRATEVIDAPHTVALLNSYYRLCAARCEAAGGTVLSMAGDRLMAAFGVPAPTTDPVRKALGAALSVQQRFSGLRHQMQHQFGVELGLGVGIDYGPMTAGFLGSKTQLQYTVVGRTVNIAARLESLAPSGGVLLSERAFLTLPQSMERIQVLVMHDFPVRGLTESQTVYCIQAA